jgi:hypothetical protein
MLENFEKNKINSEFSEVITEKSKPYLSYLKSQIDLDDDSLDNITTNSLYDDLERFTFGLDSFTGNYFDYYKIKIF